MPVFYTALLDELEEDSPALEWGVVGPTKIPVTGGLIFNGLLMFTQM
jgi:hypothetical protein